MCVYFGTGGQNGISGPARVAGNYVFRTHSITFTRNDVYMTSTTKRLNPKAAQCITLATLSIKSFKSNPSQKIL